MPLLRRIKWRNLTRLVITLFLTSISILSIFNFIKLYDFMDDIDDISTKLNSYENKIDKIVSEGDFESLFIVGKVVGNYGSYRDIKIVKKELYEEMYENRGYKVIGEFNSLRMENKN